MKQLTGICILTHNVTRLKAFYQEILQAELQEDGDVYAAFLTNGIVLSMFSVVQMESLAPGSTAGYNSGSFSLEFPVDDPDAEYARLLTLGATVVNPPTTFPWGNRAVWFLDPDGNHISFYKRLV